MGRAFLLAAVAGVVAASCDPMGAPHHRAVVDTVGSTVRVFNPPRGLWSPDEEWSVREAWRVGGVNAPEGYQFSNRLQSIAPGPEGTIYVLDFTASLIRVFAPDGTFRFSFGRPGEGPAELSRPFALGWAEGDQLWVAEAFNGQYTVFDAQGEFLTTYRRPIRRFINGEFRLAVDDAGRVHEFNVPGDVQGVLRIDPVEGRIVEEWLLVRPPDRADNLPTYFRPGGDQAAREFSRTLQSRAVYWWSEDGSVLVHNTGDRVVLEIGPSGDTTRVIGVEHRQRDLSASERSIAVEAERAVGIPLEQAAVPTYLRLERMADGHILAQVAGDRSVPTRDMDVFDPIGRFLGTIQLPFTPARQSSMAIVGDTIFGLQLGDLDVPVLVRAEIDRPVPSG